MSLLRCRLNLLEHVAHADQMIVENAFGYIEKLEQGPVRNGVIRVAAGFPANDNVAHSQDRKLLKDVRLLNL